MNIIDTNAAVTEPTTAKSRFETPHEQSRVAKAKKPKAAKAKPAKVVAKGTGTWGAQAGSRMEKINAAVVKAGKAGITTQEVAAATKERVSIVSAQLAYHLPKGNCTRKEVTVGETKTFRYFAKIGTTKA